MSKYHFNIKINERDNNAGNKAIEDCKTILLKKGYINLEISFVKTPLLLPFNLVKLFLVLLYYTLIIPSNSIVVVQYPLLGINPFFKYFIRILKLKSCKFACIIHDIDSLRSDYNVHKIEKEIDALSAYNAVISHNKLMTAWLKEQGYKGYITEILLFDYLAAYKEKKENDFDPNHPEIVFAGNLGRGNFLEKLADTHKSFSVNLYGPGFKKTISERDNKMKWFGSFAPEVIVNEIKGDFGLIWDGDSIEDVTGLAGKYLQYNTPHKTSLYLSSGLPVIISRKAAIADFIEQNNLGFCISGLSDITSLAMNFEGENYMRMKEKVLGIGQKLRNGYFFEEAIIKTENFFAPQTDLEL